jgi:hypothetical protein
MNNAFKKLTGVGNTFFSRFLGIPYLANPPSVTFFLQPWDRNTNDTEVQHVSCAKFHSIWQTQ